MGALTCSSHFRRAQEAVAIHRLTIRDVAQVNEWLERDSGFPVDFTETLSNELNICLACGEGGAIFVWRGPGIYEVHCFFEQRGAEVLDIARATLNLLWAEYGAKIVWAAIPLESRKVRLFARWTGFKSFGSICLPHGACELFQLEQPPCRQQ
jgi:hypothetical protein